MKLYMPTKVYNEKGCVRQHSQELAALGTKALLVTGKHSSRVNGSLQDVKDALNREQVPYVVFDGIEENPSVATVMRATALGLSEKVDFVIGIGGGSPMDASKAIALMIANPEKKQTFYMKQMQRSNRRQIKPCQSRQYRRQQEPAQRLHRMRF